LLDEFGSQGFGSEDTGIPGGRFSCGRTEKKKTKARGEKRKRRNTRHVE